MDLSCQRVLHRTFYKFLDAIRKMFSFAIQFTTKTFEKLLQKFSFVSFANWKRINFKIKKVNMQLCAHTEHKMCTKCAQSKSKWKKPQRRQNEADPGYTKPTELGKLLKVMSITTTVNDDDVKVCPKSGTFYVTYENGMTDLYTFILRILKICILVFKKLSALSKMLRTFF